LIKKENVNTYILPIYKRNLKHIMCHCNIKAYAHVVYSVLHFCHYAKTSLIAKDRCMKGGKSRNLSLRGIH